MRNSLWAVVFSVTFAGGFGVAAAQEMMPADQLRPLPAHHAPATQARSATQTARPTTHDLAKIPPDLSQRVEQLVTQLDDDDFKKREAASAALAEIPAEAVPYLEDQLKRADLPPEARSRIEIVIGPLRNRFQSRSRRLKLRQWNHHTLLNAYQQVGNHNAKWDNDVESALTQAEDYFAHSTGDRTSYDLGPMLSLTRKALDEGCDDPLVRYLYDRFYNIWVRPVRARPPSDLGAAALALEKSKYPPFRKAAAEINAAFDVYYSQNDPEEDETKQSRESGRTLLALAAAHIPEMLADKDTPPEILMNVCESYLNTFQLIETLSGHGVAARTKAYEALDAVLARRLPEDNPVRLMVKSYFDSTRAQDEAGKYGEGPQAVSNWRNQAASAASEAWAQDKKSPEAPLAMLELCRQLALPSDVEERWFDRAIDVDPDSIEPYQKKLRYLQETQGDDDALEFARQCVQSRRWAARIPFVLVQYRMDESPGNDWYWDDRLADYWSKADVWDDVTSAYDTYLSRYPNSYFDHSYYAFLAYHGRHWAVADRQLKLAGQHVDYQVFGGQEAYETICQEVAMRLKNPAPQPSARELADKYAQAETAYYQRVFADAYEKFGHKNDRWNDDARALLGQAVLLLSQNPQRTRGEEDGIRALSAKLSAEGCDDPLIRYVGAYVNETYFKEELAEEQMSSANGHGGKPPATAAAPIFISPSFPAAVELAKSDYPASARLEALITACWMVEHNDTRGDAKRKADVRSALQTAQALLPAALAEKDWYLDDELTICDAMMAEASWIGDGRKSMYERLQTELGKVYPINSAKMLCLQGFYERGTAFDIHEAAGGKAFDQFTGPPRVAFDQHMTVAEKFFASAWMSDPTAGFAADQVLYVSDVEDRPRAYENFWFRRAMLANADDFYACQERMAYLGIFHHGSDQLMNFFGGECYATGNWAAEIPLLLGMAQNEIGKSWIRVTDDPQYAYLKYDYVWHEIAGTYGAYVEKYPAATEQRSMFAKLACLSRKWDVAEAQFKLLGDHPRLSVFGTRGKYEALRRQAAAEAAKPKPKGEMIAPQAGN